MGDIGDVDEYEFSFEITYLGDLPEGYQMYLTGNFTSWSIEVDPLIKGLDGKYRITFKKPLLNLNLEYMIVIGTTFNWDQKLLKEDGSEYPEGENLEHTLSELVETITFTAPKFKGLDDGEEHKEYTVDYVFTVPSDFPEGYHVYLLGTMTNDWSTEDALTFEKVEDVLQVTFNIDYNLDHLFLLYLEKGQANWWDHKAADSINEGWDNYILKADYLANNTEVSLDVAYWLGLENTIAATILTQSDFGATNSITIEGSKTTKNRFHLDSIIIYYSNPA